MLLTVASQIPISTDVVFFMLIVELWHQFYISVVNTYWAYSIQSHHIYLCFIDFQT